MGSYAMRAGWFGWVFGGRGSTSGTAPVGGVVVPLTMERTLRNTPQPAAAQFTATVAGVSRGVASVSASGSVLTVTLAAGNLTAGQAVVITYAPGVTVNTRLAYSDGQEVRAGTFTVTAA